MSTTTFTKEVSTCYHCGESCNDNTLHIDEKSFCCDGCKLVYEILDENELCNYYDISQSPGIQTKGKFASSNFAYLDDEKVKAKLLDYTNGKQSRVTLHLPQIHCSSCIWLLENLHRINNAVIKSRTDFARKEISILYNEEGASLRTIVELLAFIGYTPLITLNYVENKGIKKHNHSQIIKIGIAGFCFGNIMMLSFPEYFSDGIIKENNLKQLFSYLNLSISLPVFFYCATEFFISAWKGIQQKFINIDAPVSLAIITTFVRSVYEILSGSGAGYMDSMSGIVFFMLLGRYFQNYTNDTLSFERDYKSYFPVSVSLIKDEQELSIPVSNIKIGDRIRIKNNELIPADSIVFKGDAQIDYSFVTGESAPVHKVLGEIIYAGGKQLGSAIELEVVKDISQSYLTQLWNDDTFKQTEKEDNSFIHALGKYFTIFLLLLATGGFLYWLPNIHAALNAFTAVLIVACPCALLLASTFTDGNTLRIFGKHKFYLKNSKIISSLKKVDTIVFDKTGTITQNNASLVSYQGIELSTQALGYIKALAKQSSHPLSKAIDNHINSVTNFNVTNFKELLGKGIQGEVNGEVVKLGASDFVIGEKHTHNDNSSNVFVSINNVQYGCFQINNQYRAGIELMIKSLGDSFHLAVLSGDNDSEKHALSNIFNSTTSLNFHQSPIDKLNYVKKLQQENHTVAMIGDGLNDAGALQQSDVGIVISDNTNNFSPACDAILDAKNITQLQNFISFATTSQRIIMASFAISICYNIVGIWLAITGNLSPVLAAILMPISSITVVLFTTGMTNFMAKRLFTIF